MSCGEQLLYSGADPGLGKGGAPERAIVRAYLPTLQGFQPLWLFCISVQGFVTFVQEFLVRAKLLIVSINI